MTTQLQNKIEDIINNLNGMVTTYEGLTSEVIINEGANQIEINKCNSYFGNRLPNDYISFLRNYNGGFFFKVDDIGGLKFWSCDVTVKQNRFQKEQFGDQWDNDIILICECIGDGDYIGIKIVDDNSYEMVDCFGEEVPSNWKAIKISFDSFLEKLLDEKGRKFWLDY